MTTNLNEVSSQMESPLKLWALNVAFAHFGAHGLFELFVGTRDVGGTISHSIQEAFEN